MPHIPADKRLAFESSLKGTHPSFAVTTRDGNGGYTPENGKSDYYPIAYSYPPRDIAQGLGYDVSGDALRRHVIEEARRTGKLQASGLTEFLNSRDQDDLKGVVVYAPVLSTSAAHKNGQPYGYISSSISLRKLLDAAIAPLSPQGVNIILTDLSADSPDKRILKTRSTRLANVAHDTIVESLNDFSLMRESATIDFANRKWEIIIIQSAGFFSTKPPATFYVILIGGFLGTLLFTLYLVNLSREKDRIRVQVLDRTAALNRAKRNTELILASTHEGIIGINRHGNISFCNPFAANLLGYNPNDNLIGRDYHETIRPALNGNAIPRAQCHILQVLHDGNKAASSIYDFTRADEQPLPVEFTAAPVIDDSDISGAVIIFRDVAERRANEQRMTHAAGHDQMTGLYNRRSFDTALESAVARAERSGRKCALLYMDLNGFKKINDTLGHDAGDLMLKAFAERLKDCMRDTDSIARLGGDEFAVICELIDNVGDCEAAVRRLLANIDSKPVDIDGADYFLSSSIGIALYPDNAQNSIDLVKAADKAMYTAKKD